MYELIKVKVIQRIANGKPWKKAVGDGQVKWLIGNKIVHVKYRKLVSRGVNYAYNIGSNTLASDFEVWICGSADYYYLIPIRVIEAIYNHPCAYVDSHHPKLRVPYINVDNDQCRYAPDEQTIDFSSYFCATM